MYLYYIFITVFYLIYVILFYKDYERLQNKYFDLLNDNCDLHLEKLDLIKENVLLREELRNYKKGNKKQ